MELRHLRYFIAVAEAEHITRAAERLGIQPPPLSRQIKAMEKEIGVQLFCRKPRGVELTDAGRALLDDAHAMLAHLGHAFDTARRTARGEQGRISVGYTTAYAFHPLVPRVIGEFQQAFPLVHLTLEESSPYDLIERVQADQIDAVFMGMPASDPEGLAIDLLIEEPMMVALPRGHALIRSEKGRDTALALKSLAGESFIAFGRAHSPSTMQTNAIAAACQAAGFNPRVGHVVPNNLSRLNLVAAGLGIAIVPISFQRVNIDGVVYRRLKGATQLKIPLNLASRHGDTSAVVRQFLKLAKRTAKSYHAD
jgi:DNA-binding transcriptional LysR family regulator